MDKEVRFTEKKIDQSWKEDVAKEKGKSEPDPSSGASLSFSAFLTSLGYQTLMHLGELAYPETQERHVNMEAARETIDLLVLLEKKTQGNRTPEEDKLLKTLLPELQMKFVQKTSAA